MTPTDWNGRVLKGKSEAFKKAQHFFRIYPYRSPSTVIPHKMIKKQKTKTKKSKKKKSQPIKTSPLPPIIKTAIRSSLVYTCTQLMRANFTISSQISLPFLFFISCYVIPSGICFLFSLVSTLEAALHFRRTLEFAACTTTSKE